MTPSQKGDKGICGEGGGGVQGLHLGFPKASVGMQVHKKARGKPMCGNAGTLGMENISKSRDVCVSSRC